MESEQPPVLNALKYFVVVVLVVGVVVVRQAVEVAEKETALLEEINISNITQQCVALFPGLRTARPLTLEKYTVKNFSGSGNGCVCSNGS